MYYGYRINMKLTLARVSIDFITALAVISIYMCGTSTSKLARVDYTVILKWKQFHFFFYFDNEQKCFIRILTLHWLVIHNIWYRHLLLDSLYIQVSLVSFKAVFVSVCCLKHMSLNAYMPNNSTIISNHITCEQESKWAE